MMAIDLVNLKKLATAVAAAPQGSAAWDKATDALNEKFNAGGLVELIKQLEAARDDREELKEQVKTLNSRLASCKGVKQSFKDRAWTAEEELKRRDAQEPVADVVLWEHPTEERKCDIRWRRHDVQPGPLYAAAHGAALPSEELYRIANHIAGAKGGLPNEWQEWAEEIESDLRRCAAPAVAHHPDGYIDRKLDFQVRYTRNK